MIFLTCTSNEISFYVVFFIIIADVVSEDAILKWYKETHSARGWSVFMDQMKKFVEWLEHAEEGTYYFIFLKSNRYNHLLFYPISYFEPCLLCFDLPSIP